MKQSVFSIC